MIPWERTDVVAGAWRSEPGDRSGAQVREDVGMSETGSSQQWWYEEWGTEQGAGGGRGDPLDGRAG